jgi:glutathione S-transferase
VSLTLYTAARCPFAARVRIALAEKAVAYDAVEIDLENRPSWLYLKNPSGKVPVLEEDEGFVLPESQVILEYLDERYPEPPLLPADPAERALARLLVERFDKFSDAYYALRRADERARPWLERQVAEIEAVLEERPFLTGRQYGLADIAYVPWFLRLPKLVAFEANGRAGEWVERLKQRPAIRAEAEVVETL